MRQIRIKVGGTPTGEQHTWAYPLGQTLGLFAVPVYDCYVLGTDGSGRAVRECFDVLRFGVHCTDGKTARVVGLANVQTHVIKAWLPNYRVHSADSKENGAWQVYGNFLIHDGPDNASEIFATIGCIEIIGERGFVRFNDLLVALSGLRDGPRADKLKAIGSGGKVVISYEAAVRPQLKRAS